MMTCARWERARGSPPIVRLILAADIPDKSGELLTARKSSNTCAASICSPSTSCPNLAPLLLRLLSLGVNVRPLSFENEPDFWEGHWHALIVNGCFPGGVTRRLFLPFGYQRVVWEASFDFSATAQYGPWTC